MAELVNAKVVVGRKWHNPEIYTMLSLDKIEMTIDLNDLVRILVSELEKDVLAHAQSGPVLTVATRARLASRLKKGLDLEARITAIVTDVVTEMKKASAHVV